MPYRKVTPHAVNMHNEERVRTVVSKLIDKEAKKRKREEAKPIDTRKLLSSQVYDETKTAVN
jgi:hypothetical protein